MKKTKMKNIIPLYREKELFTVFYHTELETYVKINHREKTYVVYTLLFLGVMYAIPNISSFYAQLENDILKVCLTFLVLFISLFSATIVYRRYYEHDTLRVVYFEQDRLRHFMQRGKAQLLKETLVTVPFFFISVFCFCIFLMTSHFFFMIVSSLSLAICFMYGQMRPLKRLKYIRKVLNE